jgi:hypothetical protein
VSLATAVFSLWNLIEAFSEDMCDFIAVVCCWKFFFLHGMGWGAKACILPQVLDCVYVPVPFGPGAAGRICVSRKPCSWKLRRPVSALSDIFCKYLGIT